MAGGRRRRFTTDTVHQFLRLKRLRGSQVFIGGHDRTSLDDDNDDDAIVDHPKSMKRMHAICALFSLLPYPFSLDARGLSSAREVRTWPESACPNTSPAWSAPPAALAR